MQRDSDKSAEADEKQDDALESSKQATLRWLMEEVDRDDPSESLFVLDGLAPVDMSLSAFEAEIANRPMVRGRAGADDFDSYVGEEIVISSEGSGSDIFSRDLADEAPGGNSAAEEMMALDFSRANGSATDDSIRIADGADILGLNDEDDIGDTPMAIRRVRREQTEQQPATNGASAPSPQLKPLAVGPESAAPPVEQPAEPSPVAANPETAPPPTLPAADTVFGSEEAPHAADEDEQPRMHTEPAELVVADSFDEVMALGEDAGDDFTVAMGEEDEAAIFGQFEDAGDDLPDELVLEEFDDALGELEGESLERFGEELAAEFDALQEAGEELASAFGEEGNDLADEAFEELAFESEAAVAAEFEPDAVVAESPADPVAGTPDAPAEEIVVEAEAVPPADVADYIASVAAPVDEEAFDRYLQAGSELPQAEEEIEALTASLDEEPELARAAEEPLPEEIQQQAAESGALIEAITPRIGPLMDELQQALAARLASLDRAADAVYADFSLVTDADSRKLALDQEYAPVTDICPDTPDSLSGLSPEQLAAIHLRLCWADSGEGCNDLFIAEPPAPVAALLDDVADDVADDIAGSGDGEAPASEPPAAGLRLVPDSTPAVFEENLFDEDLPDAGFEGLEASDDAIAAAFEAFGQEGDAEDEICGVEVDEFAEADAAPGLAEEFDDDAAAGSPMQGDSWFIPAGIKFSYSSPASGEIFADFLDMFVEEGSSELEKLEDAVAAWESRPDDEQAYRTVARVLHTIKGIAKGVGLHYYGTLIHNFETLLEGMARPAGDEETAGYFRIVNVWLDSAVRGIEHVETARTDIASEFPQLGAPAAQPEAAAAEPAPEPAAPTTDAVPESVDADQTTAAVVDDPGFEPAAASATVRPSGKRRAADRKLADEGARTLAAQQSVRITSEKLDLLLNLTNQAQQLGVRTAQNTAGIKRNAAEVMARLSSVRLNIAEVADRALRSVSSRSGSTHASHLDALEMDQYTELQEAANILREGIEDLAELVELASRNNTQAEALLKQQATVIASLGTAIRSARVVPVSRLMPGLRRLVRTVSNELGKEVAFRVVNEVGTLDRDDYSRCQTILEHMVRNALDHGIEDAGTRRAAGKGSVGQISVDAYMSGSDSVIVLRDDGKGIDPEAIRESAIRKGLEVDVASLTDEEALKLIFHKGFSTARSVSQISGRGVGMDIVLAELQEMGGDIRIESEVGRGTAFHIRIPANITVNGALMVTAGDNSYAIPLGGLIGVDQVPVAEFFAAVESGSELSMTGYACAPAYLGTLCQNESLPDRTLWQQFVPVIIAGGGQRHLAIAVDSVEEALELEIRSLGAQFSEVPGIAGAATTADGEALVALDLNVLVAAIPEGQATLVAEERAPEEKRLLALVVDDSRTQRMVATSQLESVGLETATAENGAVAIDWLNTTERLPDVILLDVEMPVKDGIQTLREIRKSARYSHLPVIMVTSRTGIKHRTMAEEAGCNGYVGKPFNFRMLLGQINNLTGRQLDLGG